VLLALIDETGKSLVFRAATARLPRRAWVRIPMGQGVSGGLQQKGAGWWCQILLRESDPAARLEINSLVTAPVHALGQIIGVLEAVNPPRLDSGAEALLVVTGIGSLAGVAINNAVLFEQLDTAITVTGSCLKIASIQSLSPTGAARWWKQSPGFACDRYDQPALQRTTIGVIHQLTWTRWVKICSSFPRAGR